MKTIRLSGTVFGAEDPNRKIRASILYSLFAAGWDIYNSNGDQQITLNNIEKKIIEADAFMFMPGAGLDDIFKAVSIFVGYQTRDAHLQNKPTVILNTDKSWDPLFELLDALQALGTIHQDYREFLLEAHCVDEALARLDKLSTETLPDSGREKIHTSKVHSFDHGKPSAVKNNVCVFCSASIADTDYLDEGYRLGQQLAQQHLGCISGAGKSGVMGSVVRGCVEADGWAAGSNVPHIIELEGLPEGLSEFWLREDIYTRMEVMIEKSDSFVIFPGGAGTLQEALALLIFKKLNHPLMLNKPIVIYNRPLHTGNDPKQGFWDKLIPMLQRYGEPEHFTVVDKLEHIIPSIEQAIHHYYKSSRSLS